jgi:transposase, IS5 family
VLNDADMNFSSQGKQLQIDEFRSSLAGLDKSNRWVKLGDALPWEEIEQLYNSRLNNGKRGAGNKPSRMIVGALVIKHKMNFSDEETILAIQENPYMQYFVGLSEFTDTPIFDSSLFVTIRKRLGTADFNDMSVSLLTLQVEKARAAAQSDREDKDKSEPGGAPSDNDAFTDIQGRYHEGSLKIDATCADAEVRYPTDIDLLHDGCKVINRYIDKLCKRFSLAHPTTYYKSARGAYFEVIKRKKKSKSLINKGKSRLLTYLIRDIRSFIDLIAINGTHLFDSLKRNEQEIAGAIIKMYHQQEQMFKQGSRTCADRIISIFQSHIRPIVRGKAKSPTEFGAKIGASIVKGYTFVDHHSWNAYNEASDLSLQIELYQQRFGFLPAKIHADKIYMNRENRKLMSELEIQAMGKPLGRPPKEAKTKEYQSQIVQSVGERNEIEATFGTGKRIYRANNIRAKLPQTANCWTAMCYFVKNVMEFLRELLHALIGGLKLLVNTGSIWINIFAKRNLTIVAS